MTKVLNNSELEKLCPKTIYKVNLYRGMKNMPGQCGMTEVRR